MNITYKGKEYELKYSFRAMMLFENIRKQAFQTKTVTDFIVFLYSIILSQSKDEVIDFNEFTDWLEDNHDVFDAYVKWLLDVYTEQANKTPENEELKKLTSLETESKN